MVHDIFGQTFFRKHSRYTRWQCCKYTVEVRICSLLLLLHLVGCICFCSNDLCSCCLLGNISGALLMHVLPSFYSSCTSLAMPCQCKKVDFISTSWKYEFSMVNCETRPVHIIGSCLILFHLDHATCQDSLIRGSSETACNSTRKSSNYNTLHQQKWRLLRNIRRASSLSASCHSASKCSLHTRSRCTLAACPCAQHSTITKVCHVEQGLRHIQWFKMCLRFFCPTSLRGITA